MPKYIDFLPVELDPRVIKRKTKVWLVVKGGTNATPLGFVKWFSRWRGYAFFPREETVYEKQCLRDIADFCEQATANHKAANRKSKNEPSAPAA